MVMLNHAVFSPCTLLAACLLWITTASGAESDHVETIRVPRTDNPAIHLVLRPGWKAEMGQAGSARIRSSDGEYALILAVLPESEVQDASASELAAEYFKGAHDHPYSATEPITLDGKSGTIFISRENGIPAAQCDTRLALVQLDRTHYALVSVVEPSELHHSGNVDIEAMLAGIQFQGQDAAAALAKGRAADAKQDFDLAIAYYNEAIRLDSNYAEAFQRRGTASFAQNNTTRALADLSRALVLNPDLPQPYSLRGTIHAQKHEYADAISDYNEAIRLNPEYSAAYYFRAKAFTVQHDNARAMTDFNEALRLNPAFAHAYSGRATVYVEQGEYERAIADYSEALRLRPDHAGLINTLAWLWATAPDAKLRDGEKALEFANKACELSKWKEPAYIDTLAAAFAENGKFAEAVKWETKYLAGKLTQELADGARARLKLYQEKKPYHQPTKSTSTTTSGVPKT